MKLCEYANNLTDMATLFLYKDVLDVHFKTSNSYVSLFYFKPKNMVHPLDYILVFPRKNSSRIAITDGDEIYYLEFLIGKFYVSLTMSIEFGD
jgi:hypothetical protein